MATSFFYIYLMATSFFYIHVMATSFFYIYIDICIYIYKLTERPVVLLNAVFSSDRRSQYSCSVFVHVQWISSTQISDFHSAEHQAVASIVQMHINPI